MANHTKPYTLNEIADSVSLKKFLNGTKRNNH